MVIYKNRYSGIELTEEQYDALLQREGEALWNNLDEEEKAEWSSKEEYIETTKESDDDFIVIREEY